MSSGFRIGRNRQKVDASLVAKFRDIPTANISDVMNRMTAGGSRLRPVGVAALAGPALTVKTAPGDNLMVHKAIHMADPGDVVVVDAGGDLTNAIIGERMVLIAQARGIAGFVINGAVRDLEYLRSCPMPVFAAGVTHRGPYKNGPGEIHYPIAIDGMVIASGDLIIGDDDGLICIGYGDADAVCVTAAAKAEAEKNSDPVANNRDWIDKSLKRLGCEIDQ